MNFFECLTDETNRYADDFLQVNKDKLSPYTDFKKWPESGISSGKMRAFLALIFYFGIVKKDLLKSSWSTDSVLITPFLRTVMSRVDFYNIVSFLHCCNNSEYISKGQPGYNPKKKFVAILSTLKEKFSTLWTPRQHISINEGTASFKGNIHFRVYNPNKPDKYGIRTFKLCDSTNGYCCSFDKKQGYIVYMNNFYTSPYLFYQPESIRGYRCLWHSQT